jgi:serine/threonine-protein phosphatase PGAM5
MPRRIIYLVRHGNYTRDVLDPLEGGLSELGHKQAKLTAKRLSQLPIAAIYHSDLRRAAETAAAICARFPNALQHASRSLRECVPAIPNALREHFEGLSQEEVEHDRAQAERAFDKYFTPLKRGERHEVIVAHGNIIRYFVCRLLDIPLANWLNLDVRQGSITEVVLEPNWNRVNALGDVGHLPSKMWTFV